MQIEEMTRGDFYKVPFRTNNETICRCAVILPAKDNEELHCSGYRKIYIIAVDEESKPICKISGTSDIIYTTGTNHDFAMSNRWTMDCLPKSGLLNLFCIGKNLKIGNGLGEIEIMSI